MKVALYARVSTGGQDAGPQMAALRRWAESHGHTVHLERTDVISGRSTVRDGLQEVVKAARARHVMGIAVVKLDRFGRSVAHASSLIRSLYDRGVAFWAIDQGIAIDPSASGMEAASGRLVLHVMGAMAEFEADLISERTKAGLAAKAAAGVVLGRPTKPCLLCGAARGAGAPFGKHKGRRVPLCGPCKAAKGSKKGSPSVQGAKP